MQIESIQNLFIKEYRNQKSESKSSGSSYSSEQEKVNIDLSNEGKALADQKKMAKTVLQYVKGTREIDKSKIEAVKNRIKSGFYDSEKVHQSLAEKLSGLLGGSL